MIREIILVISSKANESVDFPILSNIVIQLYKNIDNSIFLQSHLPKLLNDKYLHLKAAKLLIQLILHKVQKSGSENKDNGFLQKVIESTLILWSDINFVRKASSLHLKCTSHFNIIYFLVLTNIIRNLISEVPKEFLQLPEIIDLIQQGVTGRLGENNSQKFHRKCGSVT